MNNRARINHLETLLVLNQKYLGKRLVEFETFDYTSRIFSSNKLKRYQFSLVVFLIGGCSSCFEREALEWDNLISDMKNKGLFGIGVNISLDDNLVSYYLKERTINYPVLHGHDVFLSFLNDSKNFEVLAILVNSELMIEKVHASLPNHPELASTFADEVRSYLTAS